MKSILNFIEQHTTLFGALLFPILLSILGILIKKKNNHEPGNHSNNQIQGNNNIIGDNNFVSTNNLNDDKNLSQFAKNLQNPDEWHKEIIEYQEVWFYKDINFKIEIGIENREQFSEDWTQKFPDKDHSSLYPVYLCINNQRIKELNFISCDGGRIRVPIPERKNIDEKIYYYWDKNSIKFKVGLIVGNFYIYNNIYKLAEYLKFQIL